MSSTSKVSTGLGTVGEREELDDGSGAGASTTSSPSYLAWIARWRKPAVVRDGISVTQSVGVADLNVPANLLQKCSVCVYVCTVGNGVKLN